MTYPASAIYSSVDGSDWFEMTASTQKMLNAVTWTGKTFVAVGEDGTIQTSVGSSTWKSRVSGTSDPIYGITWAGNRLVAVGYGGMILTSP